MKQTPKEYADSLCKCKLPKPRTKVSENGIHTYCTICAKEYSNNCLTQVKDDSFFCEGQYDEGGDKCEKECDRCKNL